MFRAPALSRVVRLTLAVPVLAGLVAGCSMAGLPGFKPAAPKAIAAIAPTPQTRPASEGEAFVPLAFAEAPARTSSAGVDGLIAKYASVYDVPESLVRRVVQRESGFNPAAKARTSSASGVFQFVDQTWLSTLKKHGAKYGYARYADLITPGSDGRYRVEGDEARKAVLGLKTDPHAASLMAGELLVVIRGRESIGFLLTQNRAVNDSSGLLAIMLVILVIGIVVDSLVFGTLERAIRRRWGLLEPAQ